MNLTTSPSPGLGVPQGPPLPWSQSSATHNSCNSRRLEAAAQHGQGKKLVTLFTPSIFQGNPV